MKKLLLSAIIIALVGSTCFIGCKKGEDDPFFSIKGRDSRLTGEWELVEFAGTHTNTTTETTTTTYSYDGTTLTKVITPGSSDSYTYSFSMTINKDGTVEYLENNIYSYGIYKYEGTDEWYWLDSAKDKTDLVLNVALVCSQGMFHVKQLKSKEMVLISNYIDNANYDGNLDNDKYEYTWTFEKQ